MNNPIKIVLSTALVALIIVTYMIYSGQLWHNTPSTKKYPIRGLDVSHHQGEINWETVPDQYRFVFIKATEGQNFSDPRFFKNWLEAKAAGKIVGGYHFYRNCTSGKLQAEHIIRTIPKEENTLPPVIDLEFYGNCETEQSKEDILKEIKICLDVVEKHYERLPIIYTMYDFYKKYDLNELNYPIWVRDIISTPYFSDGRQWKFWQFSNRGIVEGIDAYVDKNVFYGSEDEFFSIYK